MANYVLVTVVNGHNTLKNSNSITPDYVGVNIGADHLPITEVSSTAFGFGSKLLSLVSDPLTAQDAATKNYVDGLDALDIKKDGSVSYTGNQPMASHKLTGLSPGSAPGDSVRYEQAILSDGSNTFTGDQSLGGHKITSLANGTNPGDAVNFSQLGAVISGGATTALSNLASTAVNADINPAADVNVSLGSNSFRYSAVSALALSAGANQLTLNGTSINASSLQIHSVADPSSPQDAATKNYVDTLDLTNIKRDGSTAFTGAQSMGSHKLTSLSAATANGDAVRFEQAVLVDGSHAITGNQSFSGTAKITNLVDPTTAQDGATKAYVDSAIAGLSWKEAVLAASVANVTVSSAPSTLDGYTLQPNDRVLLLAQTAPAENGLYLFTAAASPLTRTTDGDSWNELVGMVVYVEQGTTNGGAKYVNTNAAGGTLGTTPVTFTTFAAASALDGVGTSSYNAFWTSAHTLAAEQFVATLRGGLGVDASAFTGLLKFSAGSASASSLVNADVSNSAAIAYSKLALTGSIVNADVNASAAIAYTKLALTGSIVNGDINASAGIVYSKLALSNSIVNADINASAAIAYSKLALAGSIVNADIATGAAIAYAKLNLATSIVNADINASAAIAYSKLALTNSIVNADIAAAAAIGYSKLALTNSIVNADIASLAAIAYSKLALTGSIVNADVAAAAAIKYSKLDFTESFTNDNAGTITVRQVAYIKSNGHIDLAAAATANLGDAALVVVNDASIVTTAAGFAVVQRGTVIPGYSGLTPGKKQYVSATPGALTETPTTTSGQAAYCVGRAMSATQLVFDPQFEYDVA